MIPPRYGVQCDRWLGRPYSEKPSQTYGNMVLGETAKANPCQSHQPTLACNTALCVCVCVSVFVYLCLLSPLHTHAHSGFPANVTCCACLLVCGLLLYNYNTHTQTHRQRHTHTHTHTHKKKDREREGGSPMAILDVNQISSSVGNLWCLIKP